MTQHEPEAEPEAETESETESDAKAERRRARIAALTDAAHRKSAEVAGPRRTAGRGGGSIKESKENEILRKLRSTS